MGNTATKNKVGSQKFDGNETIKLKSLDSSKYQIDIKSVDEEDSVADSAKNDSLKIPAKTQRDRRTVSMIPTDMGIMKSVASEDNSRNHNTSYRRSTSQTSFRDQNKVNE